MLDNKVTLEPDSIERLFCEPFGNLPVREMTVEEVDMFIKMLSIEKENPLFKIEDMSNDIPQSIKAINSFLHYRFSFEMTDALKVVIAYMCESFGKIIMYMTFLQFKSKKMGKKKLSVIDLGGIFPRGFPKDESMSELWVNVKVNRAIANSGGSDNLLDYQTALKSIHFD